MTDAPSGTPLISDLALGISLLSAVGGSQPRSWRGPEDGFKQSMAALQAAKDDDTAGTAQIVVLKETGMILRRERAVIEAPGRWRLWVSQRLREWLRRILTPPSRW